MKSLIEEPTTLLITQERHSLLTHAQTKTKPFLIPVVAASLWRDKRVVADEIEDTISSLNFCVCSKKDQNYLII